MACSTNFTKSVDMVYKRAQFELRDDSNGVFADVFELRLVFVEVKDSQGLRPVRSDNRRRHWEGSLVVAVCVIDMACNGDFYSYS